MTATRVYVATGTVDGTTTPTDFTIAGESRTPTGVVCMMSSLLANNQKGNHCLLSYGVSDFTFQAVNASSSSDGMDTLTRSSQRNNYNSIAQITNDGRNTIQRQFAASAIVGGVRLTPDAVGSSYFTELIIIFGTACKAFSQGYLETLNTPFDIPHGFLTAPKAAFYSMTSRGNNQTTNRRISYGFHALVG